MCHILKVPTGGSGEKLGRSGGTGGLPGGFAAQLCWQLSVGSRRKPWAPFQAEEGLLDLVGISNGATSLLS